MNRLAMIKNRIVARRHSKPRSALTAFGRTRTLAQWARAVDLTVGTLHTRIKLGWPLERALTERVARRADGRCLNGHPLDDAPTWSGRVRCRTCSQNRRRRP